MVLDTFYPTLHEIYCIMPGHLMLEIMEILFKLLYIFGSKLAEFYTSVRLVDAISVQGDDLQAYCYECQVPKSVASGIHN